MFNLVISIVGLLIVLLLTLSPPMIHENFFWRKPLVGLVFSLICVVGVFAAVFPKKCSQRLHFKTFETNLTSRGTYSMAHHPNCGEFSSHVIYLKDQRLCAACTGLLSGALIALLGAFFYFFGSWQIEEMKVPIVLIGVASIVLGFAQLKFSGFVRLTMNMLFVLGPFLVLIGIDELTKSFFIDLFLTAFIVFWIFTRIQFSQWDHWQICSHCKSPCEVLEVRKIRA
jgi:hypothetical protein